MRISTVFRRLLGVSRMLVESVEFSEHGVVVGVRPRWRKPRCSRCGRCAPQYDKREARRWRHLSLGRCQLWLQYAPRRVTCCGVVTEQVPWARPGSRFTEDFEELVAYLAQITDKTQVTKLMRVSWHTVGSIVDRVITERLDPTRFDDLRRIGIDEFSHRRRHRYLTTVVDHDRRRVVWAGPRRSADTLHMFFEELGHERCQKIEFVSIDMAGGYIRAIEDRLSATIVFDRFHVQQLASAALDEVRRTQLRDLRGTPEGRDLFRSRFALLKNPWNLNLGEQQKLKDLQKTNAKIYRAYLLKESLAKALDYVQPWRAKRALEEWLAWASRSKLKPFVRAARTIRKHLDGIMAYFTERLTNGIVEGFNSKIRMVARRAFGFHSHEPLCAMIYLCCGGIALDPPLPSTHQN